MGQGGMGTLLVVGSEGDWAAITWLAYLIYMHYRLLPKHNPKLALWGLIVAFILLQMCWWGIKFLPSAQGASVHVYNM